MVLIVHTKNLTISYFISTHRQTIHQKTIKQLPNFISERFSKNFFSKEIFDIAKAEYKVSQKNSTNNVDLKYTNNK